MIKQSNMSLTEKVLDYQKNGLGFNELYKELSLKAYYYPRYKLKWKLDLCSDFLLFFYPAIHKTIRSYQDIGRSFDHYFNSTLYWQLLAFMRKQKKENIEWAGSRDFWDIPCLESTEADDENCIDLKKVLKFNNHNRINYESEKRQFLFFALKKCRSMTENNVQYLAAVTGYEKEWINTLVIKLRSTIQNKERRFVIQQCRKRNAFAKMLILEQRIKNEYNTEKRARLQTKIVRLRTIYNNACNRISRLQLIPTQDAIARVTGYPKGTVDSAICAFKKKLMQVY